MEEMLIEKARHRTFLHDTKSPNYRDQRMRANAWEGIGKELKIKLKFYVSSRDVRIVCPRLNVRIHVRGNKIKVKEEVSHLTLGTHVGRDQPILNIESRWEWLWSRPVRFYPCKITPLLFDYEAGCATELVWKFWRSCLLRVSSLGSSSPVGWSLC